MDFERPRRNTSSSCNTNQFFICFTSLLSRSSSMKISYINNTSSISLSPSRSHSSDPSNNSRLRPSNSIKRSPVFPSGSTKKRSGSAFDNREPSSPKVTCIGQVRARRSKKQGKIKMMRIRSKRSRNGNRGHEQKWVHFPLTICEGIKALFPCNSSSSCIVKSEKEKEVRERACGSVLEVMVEREKEERGERSRVVLDGLEFDNEREDPSRKSVSICTPPKNALLLMRCRSDPVKMAALANRLLEYSNPENEELELDENEGEGKVEPPFLQETELQTDEEECQKWVYDDQDNPKPENEENPERTLEIGKNVEENPEKCLEIDHKLKEDEEEEKLDIDYKILVEKEILMLVDETAIHEGSKPEEPKTLIDPEVGFDGSKERESKSTLGRENPVLPDCLVLMMCEPKLSMEVSKETWVCSTDFIRWLPAREKKTKVIKMNGQDEPQKRISIANNNPAQCTQQQLIQPPRSSCSFPAQTAYRAMASLIEEKLVTAKAHEPFVLTRCKSEPKKSAVKLAPEACLWKNRKVKLSRPATVCVGAADISFYVRFD